MDLLGEEKPGAILHKPQTLRCSETNSVAQSGVKMPYDFVSQIVVVGKKEFSPPHVPTHTQRDGESDNLDW